MKTLETKLHYYYYNVSNENDRNEYNELKNRLKSKDYHFFNYMESGFGKTSNFYNEKIKPLDGKTIELDLKYLFSNQWNTTEKSGNLRVHNWAEPIYPNKDIKRGYWLEITKEMIEVLNNTLKCGYIGEQVDKSHTEKFNLDALGSQYLKEEDLYLLRFKPVSFEGKREQLTKEESDKLLPLYIQEQTKANKQRQKDQLAKKKIEILDNYNKAIEKANNEYKGFKWLLDKNINLDNCIYYNHSDTFCFGWRNELNFNIAQEMRELLKDFPFKWKLKTKELGTLNSIEN